MERNDLDARMLLRRLFQAAVQSALPAHCLAPYLPPAPAGRFIVIGAGKAAAAMARAVEDHYSDVPEGLVVTRRGYAVPCRRIEVVEASHPVPDQAGMAAAERILARVSGLGPEDWVLCLLSGGGSALMAAPLPGLTLADKQVLSRALLASGAAISEINCVRRHLSAIKGGRLAAACYPARLLTLLISDVPGDAPLDIASGPTVADPTRCEDVLEILDRYAIAAPAHVRAILQSGMGESLKPGDPRLAHTQVSMVASPMQALAAAAEEARRCGWPAHILGDALEGEAREVGKVLAGMALSVARHGQPFKPPCILLSGGETSVSVRGQGVGGRNVEYLLSLALALKGEPGIHALAADTDGVDGMADIAGAFITPDTLARAHQQGLLPRRSLAENDGHRFFTALGDSLVTGPTLTNVNDFRAILIE